MKVKVNTASLVAGGVTGRAGEEIEIDDVIGADLAARGIVTVIEGAKAPEPEPDPEPKPAAKKAVSKAKK